MAFREVQTAAARVLYADHATESVKEELTSRFRLHPHDAERLFDVPLESSFSTYGSYALVNLVWPNPAGPKASSIQVLIDRRSFVIIGDTPSRIVVKWIEALVVNTNQPSWQQSPSELLQLLLGELRAPWGDLQATAALSVAQRFASMAIVLRQFARWWQAQPGQSAVESLILEAHHLDQLADRFRPLPEKVAQSTTIGSPEKFPRLVGTYAVAVVVMMVLVIVTLSTR